MEPDAVIEAINAGDLDGRLDGVVAAVVDRARQGDVGFRWRLCLDGDTWTEESVTLGELQFVESRCWVDGVDERGRPWRRRATRADIDPRVRSEHAVALIVAHLHKAQGANIADAIKRAEAIPASDLEHVIGVYEVARPPLDDSPESTTSSPTT